MEWMSQGGNRQGQPTGQHQQNHAAGAGKTKKKGLGPLTGMKLVHLLVLLLVTALVVGALFFVVRSKSESRFVDDSKLQAVFLNGGQVYFGDIDDLNSKFINMSNIYYLRVNQQVQPNQESAQAGSNDISLVKLGCELHGPQDRMVINREQVIFWENLKDDGQVAKAVQDYKAQNPGPQNCASQQGTQTNTNNQNSTPATGTEESNGNN